MPKSSNNKHMDLIEEEKETLWGDEESSSPSVSTQHIGDIDARSVSTTPINNRSSSAPPPSSDDDATAATRKSRRYKLIILLGVLTLIAIVLAVVIATRGNSAEENNSLSNNAVGINEQQQQEEEEQETTTTTNEYDELPSLVEAEELSSVPSRMPSAKVEEEASSDNGPTISPSTPPSADAVDGSLTTAPSPTTFAPTTFAPPPSSTTAPTPVATSDTNTTTEDEEEDDFYGLGNETDDFFGMGNVDEDDYFGMGSYFETSGEVLDDLEDGGCFDGVFDMACCLVGVFCDDEQQ